MKKSMKSVLSILALIGVSNAQDLMAYGNVSTTTSIVSSDKWRVTTNPGVACPAANCKLWTDINYDDSQWQVPVVTISNGVTTPQGSLPGTKAKFMWHPDNSAKEAYFRYKFTLNSTNKTLPSLAEAFVEADDYFELWVNGNFVTSGILAGHYSSNGQWNPQVADMTPYLQDGENVIAIRANDGGCAKRDVETGKCLRIPDNGAPSDLGYKNVFFDGVISTQLSK